MDKKIVDRLFDRLKAIFPKWREIWTTDGELKAAKQQWMKSIVKGGLADPQIIKLGLEKAQTMGWVRPPSVSQFCQWCTEGAMELAGIPDEDTALVEIMSLLRGGRAMRHNADLSPAMYQVCRNLDWSLLNTMEAKQVEIQIKRAHKAMLEKWRRGEAFDEKPVMIEKKALPPQPNEAQRKKGIERLREIRRSITLPEEPTEAQDSETDADQGQRTS